MVVPKKYLGQHFLVQKEIARQIVELLCPHVDEVIVEVGPGKGVLTEWLLKYYPNTIHAVDIDKESIEYLKNHLASPRLQIEACDILAYPLNFDRIAFIGNLPYNISSGILFRLVSEQERIRRAVIMVQKEVAERIAANEGNKQYGILSVLLGMYYERSISIKVKPGSFFPVPKVDSAVVVLERKKEIPTFEAEKVIRLVKTAFQQRRKILSNAVKSICMELPERYKSMRPEQISIAEYIELSKIVP